MDFAEEAARQVGIAGREGQERKSCELRGDHLSSQCSVPGMMNSSRKDAKPRQKKTPFEVQNPLRRFQHRQVNPLVGA
jgi:hypothetical protein